MIKTCNGTIFVITSEDSVNNFFQGYCFYGTDFIFGNEGYKKYRTFNSKPILLHEDGCYVLFTSKNSQTVTVSTDYWGYKKIFYYHNAGFWALSNSLLQLVGILRSKGVRLTPNYGQLSAISFRHSSTNQLFSFRTIFNEICLLKPYHILTLSKSAAVETLNTSIQATPNKIYSIEYFVELWSARLATLANNKNIKITIDLSGGLDSRAVLALAFRAANLIQREPRDFIKIQSNKNRYEDYIIAKSICEYYDLPLNIKKQPRAHIDNFESYIFWKQNFLSVYHPIYFPSYPLDPLSIKLHGGGGENYRPFYVRSEYTNEFDKVKFRFAKSIAKNGARLHPWLESDLEFEVLSAFSFIPTDFKYNPLIWHYQSFRNRFHVGCLMQYNTQICPLGSKYLYYASKRMTVDQINSGHLLYSVINICNRKLLEIPFDKPEKSPSLDIVNFLKSNSAITNYSIKFGGFFVDKNISQDLTKNTRENRIQLLHNELTDTLNNKYVKTFWPSQFINETRSIMLDALTKGRFEKAGDGQTLSAILSSGVVFST